MVDWNLQVEDGRIILVGDSFGRINAWEELEKLKENRWIEENPGERGANVEIPFAEWDWGLGNWRTKEQGVEETDEGELSED